MKHSVQTIATSIPQLQLAVVRSVTSNRVDDSYGPSWRVKSSGRALLGSVLSTQCSVTRVSAAERDKQSSSDALQVLTALSPSTEDVPNNGESWLQEVQQQGQTLAEELLQLRTNLAERAQQLAEAHSLRQRDQERLHQLQAALQEAIEQSEKLLAPFPEQAYEDLLSQLKGHAQHLEQMQLDLNANQETHTQDLESNMASFQELEAVLAQAEQHLNSVGDGNADDTWQAHWQENCAQLEARIQELQQERDAANMEVTNLQAALKASEQLSEQLHLAETNLDDMRRNLTDQEAATQGLDQEVVRLGEQQEASSDLIAQLESELQMLQSTDEARAAEFQALENELNEVRMERGGMGAWAQQAPRSTDAQQIPEQLQSLQRELDRTRASEEQKDAELEDASEVAKVLTSELERLGEVVSQQGAELQELRSRRPEADQVAQLRARVMETEEALRRAEDERQQHLQALQRLTAEQGSQTTGEDASLQSLRQKAQEEAAAATELFSKAESATKRLAEQMAKLRELQTTAEAKNGGNTALEDKEPDEPDQDTAALLDELETIVDQLDEAMSAEQAARERAQVAESHAASLHAQLIAVQEAAAGDARARQVERDQLADLRRHHGDAQAQGSALREQNEELEQQLHEARQQAQKPSRARRKTKANEQIAELESKVASVEAENRALREAAARHSALLQQSRRILSTYMEGQPRTHLNLPLEELAEDQASSSHASDGEQLGVDDAVKQSSELPAESTGVASRNGAKAPSMPAEENEGGSQPTPNRVVLNITSAADG